MHTVKTLESGYGFSCSNPKLVGKFPEFDIHSQMVWSVAEFAGSPDPAAGGRLHLLVPPRPNGLEREAAN